MTRSTPTEVVSVVGGGWSFREVDHAKVPGYVVAVNDAGLLLERPVDEIVSMDRLWTENRWDRLEILRAPTWLRRSATQNVVWESEEWVKHFDNDHTSVDPSDEEGVLNGTNSGTCAINRVYQLRPRRMYLFGFDMCRDSRGNPYWYPPYPWAREKGGTSDGKYNAWASEFNRIALAFAAIGCHVTNVSRHSRIACFEKVSAKELGMGR